MNAFQRIIAQGYHRDQYGTNGWMFAILTLGGYDYEGADVHANPVLEVLRRLELAGVGRPVLEEMAKALNTIDERYRLGHHV